MKTNVAQRMLIVAGIMEIGVAIMHFMMPRYLSVITSLSPNLYDFYCTANHSCWLMPTGVRNTHALPVKQVDYKSGDRAILFFITSVFVDSPICP
ncbi:hypothetical protein JW960_21310 [candidate division KSB1 bacterium]|nr:hypothetical protein [candidate division KSB1 bacterium]